MSKQSLRVSYESFKFHTDCRSKSTAKRPSKMPFRVSHTGIKRAIQSVIQRLHKKRHSKAHTKASTCHSECFYSESTDTRKMYHSESHTKASKASSRVLLGAYRKKHAHKKVSCIQSLKEKRQKWHTSAYQVQLHLQLMSRVRYLTNQSLNQVRAVTGLEDS